jgi:hypothetical protein
MRPLHLRTARLTGLLALALGAAALLALPGVAAARHHHGDRHGRHHAHASHAQVPTMEEAGTIASFDPTTGRLTIALAAGESITGVVTEETEIRCEGIDQRRDGGGEPGDDDGGDGGSWQESEEPPATGEEEGCSTASLTQGSVVGGAELRLEGGSAVFQEIELGLHS